jgi:hypothetical protein
MLRLPITGRVVELEPATGDDDLVLVERGTGLTGALEICRRRAKPVSPQEPLDLPDLPVGDLDVLVVALRQAELGDRLVGEGSCQRCSASVDISFNLTSYIEHHGPAKPTGAEPDDEEGWWRIARHGISCRPPTVADVITCAGQAGGRRQLLARCVRGERSRAADRAAERVMAAIAPSLHSDIAGRCPECTQPVSMDFDARSFCLRELRDRAASVIHDVVVLAGACRWSEEAILSLPTSRRAAYVELLYETGTAIAAEAHVA